MIKKNLMLIKISAVPLPGAHLDDVKVSAKSLASEFKCTVTFNYNGTEYICDDEGGCAKIN